MNPLQANPFFLAHFLLCTLRVANKPGQAPVLAIEIDCIKNGPMSHNPSISWDYKKKFKLSSASYVLLWASNQGDIRIDSTITSELTKIAVCSPSSYALQITAVTEKACKDISLVSGASSG